MTDIHVAMDNLVEDYKMLAEEREKLEEIKKAKIERINQDFTEKDNKLTEKQTYILTELRVLAEQVPQKHTKTQSKVSLLSGDVVIKKAQKKLTADKDKLVVWLEENDYAEYVIKKPTADWKEFKARLNLNEETGTIIDTQTGEALEISGVTVEETNEQVVIK